MNLSRDIWTKSGEGSICVIYAESHVSSSRSFRVTLYESCICHISHCWLKLRKCGRRRRRFLKRRCFLRRWQFLLNHKICKGKLPLTTPPHWKCAQYPLCPLKDSEAAWGPGCAAPEVLPCSWPWPVTCLWMNVQKKPPKKLNAPARINNVSHYFSQGCWNNLTCVYERGDGNVIIALWTPAYCSLNCAVIELHLGDEGCNSN